MAQACTAYQVIDPIEDTTQVVLEPDHPTETLYYPTIFPVPGGIRMLAQGGNGFAGNDLEGAQWRCGMYQNSIDSIFVYTKPNGQPWVGPPSQSCDFFRSDYNRCGYTTQPTLKLPERDVLLAPYGAIGHPSVVRIRTSPTTYRYFMAYNGGNADFLPGRVYWATSDDGIHWNHQKIVPIDPDPYPDVVPHPAPPDGPLIYARYWNCEWVARQGFVSDPRVHETSENRYYGREKGIGGIALLYDENDTAGGQNPRGTFYVYFSYSHTTVTTGGWTVQSSLAFRFDFDPANGTGVGNKRQILKDGIWVPHGGDLVWSYDEVPYLEKGIVPGETLSHTTPYAGALDPHFSDIQRVGQANRWVAIGAVGETTVEGHSTVYTQETASLSNPVWTALQTVDLGPLLDQERFKSDSYKPDGRRYFGQVGPGLYFEEIGEASVPWMFMAIRKPGLTPAVEVFAGLGIIRTRLQCCDYELNPKLLSDATKPGLAFGPEGGEGTFTVTSVANCPWTATIRSDFISIVPPTAPGQVRFIVHPNDTIARSGFITVAGRRFEVKQDHACSIQLRTRTQTIPAWGDEVVAHVEQPPQSGPCPWASSWESPDISVPPNSPRSGIGAGHVTFKVAPNTTPGERSFPVTIGNETFTIIQPAQLSRASFNVHAVDCGPADVRDHPVYARPPGVVVKIIPVVLDRQTGARLNIAEFTFTWSVLNANGTPNTGNQLERTVSVVPELIQVTATRGSETDIMLVDIIPGIRTCRHRLVRLDGEVLTSKQVPAGRSVALSPDELSPGESYEWYRQSAGAAIEMFSTSAEVYETPAVDTTYYFVATTASAAEVSDDATVLMGCVPTSVDGPRDASVSIVGTTSATVSTSVIATGDGPFTYDWQLTPPCPENDVNCVSSAVGSTLSWTTTNAGTRQADVAVRNACGVSVPGRTATLSVVDCAGPRIASISDGGPIFEGGQTVELRVTMQSSAPADAPYEYQWFRGNAEISGARSATAIVTTYSTDSYYVRVSNRCGIVYSGKVYLSIFGQCDLPFLTTSQTATSILTNSSEGVTFTAKIDFPADLQWYVGQSGDTRNPTPSNANDPNHLTVGQVGDLPRPYWVRASLDCGTHHDSETLVFSKGNCNPILFVTQPEPVDVAYGGSATLSARLTSTAGRIFTWFEGPDESHPLPQTGSTITVPNVIESGRYWVKVMDLLCGTVANSFPALVRVSSHPGITVSQWPAGLWVDKDQRATMTVNATGASGYQWFLGEAGDDSLPISGATLATYQTVPLVVDANYWVRIYGNGGLVDSPTVHVSVCDPPHFTQTVTTNQNIVAGQWTFIGVDAGGTALSYQWFVGESGQTTQPTGRNVNVLQVHPNETTDYWVRVTAACGPGGASPRVLASPTITLSVCPILNDAPTAAKSVVMPGTTTTLSINAQGTRLTYQWFIGAPGDRTNPIANSNSSTITTPPITAGTQYWVEVKSGGCARNSSAVLVGLCTEPRIAWTSSSRNIASGQADWLYVNVTSASGVLVTYYAGHAGDVAGSTVVSGPTFNQGILIGPTATTTYWARATSGDCSGDTGEVTLTVCIPTFTQQPVNRTLTLGQSVTLTVATDVPASLQWYAGAPGDTNNPVPNGTAPSLSVSPTTDTQYWVRATGCNVPVDSAGATVTVCQPPVIAQQTANTWITRGDSMPIDVSATGTGLTYQWYQGNAGVTSAPVSGAVAASTTVAPLNTTPYWARVTGGCGTKDTTTITISVCAAPSITAQPLSQSIFSGTSATLSVIATQATTTPTTYQWYSGTSGGGTAISGATSASYTTPALTASASYWVKVTAGTCVTNSATATVSVCTLPAVLAGPANQQTTVGQLVRLDVGAMSPIPDQYRWFRGTSGDTTNPITGWSATRTVDVAPTVTTSYWAQVQKGSCISRTSTTSVSVCVPTFTQQPASVTILSNQSTTLTAAANTAAVTYQWYTGTSGSGTQIAGATSAGYTTPALTSSASYWVRANGTCGVAADSATATVTVCAPASLTQQPSNSIPVNSGAASTMSVSATGTNLSYQWYLGEKGDITHAVAGQTTDVLALNPTNTEKYWVRVTGQCGAVDSNAAFMSVVPTIPAAQPADVAIPTGTAATLSATVSVNYPSYQWYASPSTPVGTSSPTFTTPALTANASYFVVVTSGIASRQSRTALITMCQGPRIQAGPWVNYFEGCLRNVWVTVRSADVGTATYRWYKGPMGDTSTLVSNSSSFNTCVTEPATYWVRISNPTCYTDAGPVIVNP